MFKDWNSFNCIRKTGTTVTDKTNNELQLQALDITCCHKTKTSYMIMKNVIETRTFKDNALVSHQTHNFIYYGLFYKLKIPLARNEHKMR